jgi:hypothetical protein
MAIGMRCETCGADTPSLGSLQMHQLRYHSGSSVPSDAATARDGSAAGPAMPGRRRAVAPLAVAVGGLLSGGAVAVTIRLVG